MLLGVKNNLWQTESWCFDTQIGRDFFFWFTPEVQTSHSEQDWLHERRGGAK